MYFPHTPKSWLIWPKGSTQRALDVGVTLKFNLERGIDLRANFN